MSPLRQQSVSSPGGGRQFSVQEELNHLRQRLKADRDRSDRETADVINQMRDAMEEARAKLQEERDAARKQESFLRKCRAEADNARASFDKDLKRRQAFIDASEQHRARRDAEKAKQAAEHQRRREHVEYGDATFGPGGSAQGRGLQPRAPPPTAITTPAQQSAFATFEAAFAAFEAAPTDAPLYGLADVPWPPLTCPVSGVRKSDNGEVRKHALKLALLRWHPDKFLSSHGGKLRDAEREGVIEKVHAVLRRVQLERAAHSDGADGLSSPHGHVASSSYAVPAAHAAPASYEARNMAAAHAATVASARAAAWEAEQATPPHTAGSGNAAARAAARGGARSGVAPSAAYPGGSTVNGCYQGVHAQSQAASTMKRPSRRAAAVAAADATQAQRTGGEQRQRYESRY